MTKDSPIDPATNKLRKVKRTTAEKTIHTPVYNPDKRMAARQQHTNHFTNRAPQVKK